MSSFICDLFDSFLDIFCFCIEKGSSIEIIEFFNSIKVLDGSRNKNLYGSGDFVRFSNGMEAVLIEIDARFVIFVVIDLVASYERLFAIVELIFFKFFLMELGFRLNQG